LVSLSLSNNFKLRNNHRLEKAESLLSASCYGFEARPFVRHEIFRLSVE